MVVRVVPAATGRIKKKKGRISMNRAYLPGYKTDILTVLIYEVLSLGLMLIRLVYHISAITLDGEAITDRTTG
jgi:hypothetical protein